MVPEIVLVKAGVWVPESMPVSLNDPLKCNVPEAPANFPVPPVILATPLSVPVPAPSGTFADELATTTVSVLPEPERLPLPLKLNPTFVEVVGTWPEPLNVLEPRSVPVPVPFSDVTVADPDVELLFTMSTVKVPEYEPVNATLVGAGAVVVVVFFAVVVVVFFAVVVVVFFVVVVVVWPAIVEVEVVVDGGLKAIDADAVSPPLALPALRAQPFKFEALVPQDPLPIVPVTTLNDVPARTPVPLTVTGVAVAVSQPPCPLAVARHSTRNRWSLGVKFVPDTVTVAPLVSWVEGWMESEGGFTIDALGITPFEGGELGLLPTLLRATTVNV